MKKRTEGFTLAELLVVVAIIGVLVAVSIPIFTGQLGKARIATDQANVRAAKVAAVAEYLSSGVTGEKYYFYDAASGTVKSSLDGIKGYGKSTAGNGETGAGGIPVSGGKANLVKVTVNADAGATPYTAEWIAGDGSSTGGSGSGGSGSSGGDSGTSGGSSSGADSNGGLSSGGSSSATCDSGATISKIQQSAGTWPTQGKTESIKTGKAYTLADGSLYIAASDQDYNQYNPVHYPTEDGYSWLGVKPSGTVIPSDKVSNGKLTVTVHCGDIYQSQDGNYYIWKNSASNLWGAPVNDGNWIQIVF